MSTKTRNTIIGVVVGVGGAIVLGALALVAWRIWGRKKQAEENDGLMAYDNGYSGAEKSEPSHSPSTSTSQRNPFQSTLENYHQLPTSKRTPPLVVHIISPPR
jgi:predicted negative regulator of RcsB-dependent stress response